MSVFKKLLGSSLDQLWLSSESLASVKTTIATNKRLGKPLTTDGLFLDELKNKLLDSANTLMAGNYQKNRHVSSSAALDIPVYEVRSRSGAAWRGAVVLDNGDPWLVYVDKHDQFDDHAASYFKNSKGSWRPTALDYKIRDAEDAVRSYQQSEIELLEFIIGGLRNAFENPGETHILPDGSGEVDVQIITASTYAGEIGISKDEEALLCLSLTPTYTDPMTVARFDDIVDYLHPNQDPGTLEISYNERGQRCYVLTLTQARLTQLVATTYIEGKSATDIFKAPGPQTVLHYLDKTTFAKSMVTGIAAKSLCGTWFVPQRDERSGESLPICEACESIENVIKRISPLINRP